MPIGKQWLDKSTGYYRIRISGKTRYVHRLVASCIPNPENKPTVNHKDGNRQNNHISNLEWATYKEQIDHKRLVLGNTSGEFRKGRIGKDAVKSRPIYAICPKGLKKFYYGTAEAARELGIRRETIKNYLRGYSKSTREGYKFEYVNY